LEYETVKDYKRRGIFAMRIPTYNQKGEQRSIDVIALTSPKASAVQCKYRKEALHYEEKQRILEFCKKYDLNPVLCYRKSKSDTKRMFIRFEAIE